MCIVGIPCVRCWRYWDKSYGIPGITKNKYEEWDIRGAVREDRGEKEGAREAWRGRAGKRSRSLGPSRAYRRKAYPCLEWGENSLEPPAHVWLVLNRLLNMLYLWVFIKIKWCWNTSWVYGLPVSLSTHLPPSSHPRNPDPKSASSSPCQPTSPQTPDLWGSFRRSLGRHEPPLLSPQCSSWVFAMLANLMDGGRRLRIRYCNQESVPSLPPPPLSLDLGLTGFCGVSRWMDGFC